jgi:hypothetical protein
MLCAAALCLGANPLLDLTPAVDLMYTRRFLNAPLYSSNGPALLEQESKYAYGCATAIVTD